MTGHLQTHLDSIATSKQRAGDVPSLLADGVDALFLEESWTLGVSAAVESQHRRRQLKADGEGQARAFRAFQNAGTASFLEARQDRQDRQDQQDRQSASEAALEDRAATIVDRYDSASSQSWAPQDWVAQDQIAHRWIPLGWLPGYMPRLDGQQEDSRCVELGDSTMTAQRARLLLEITPASTREQVRSAYRRMVGQWHPDRLQFTSEAIRDHATRHMAALNEAYRLLCATELEQAA